MSDLKPCPFCGGEEYFFCNFSSEATYICKACDASGPSINISIKENMPDMINEVETTHLKASEAWNKRDDGWISVVKEMPKHGQSVICFYINSHGNKRMVIGHYFHRWTEESVSDDDCCDEYSEERDEYYYKEGWYEQQENWGDYASIFIHEGEVTYWKKRPKFPEVN